MTPSLDLVTARPYHMIHMCIVIMEDTAPVSIERFHHRINVISQNNFVLIYSEPTP